MGEIETGYYIAALNYVLRLALWFDLYYTIYTKVCGHPFK
jgi:hypothetical protein